MAIKKVFKSKIQSCNYVFKSGKQASFIAGKYLTDIDTEIEELEAEIKSGHPHIFIDANEKEVDTEKLDPLEEIKRKAIAEYLEAQKKAVDPSNDMGSTDQSGKLEGIANSSSGAQLATNSNGAGVGARLANVKSK